MTLAVAKALKEGKDYIDKQDYKKISLNAVKYMQGIGRHYPDCGYGGNFALWIFSDSPKPYKSFGNGAAMRVSAAGFAAGNLEEAEDLSYAVTCVTHSHAEGLKGAEAVATAIYLAKKGVKKADIREYIETGYYDLDFTFDDLIANYDYDVTCQGTVPQAIFCFLESESFEDAIRNAISIGGDSDTLAAITGGIAEAYYGVPKSLEQKALTYLDGRLRTLYDECKAFNKIVEG